MKYRLKDCPVLCGPEQFKWIAKRINLTWPHASLDADAMKYWYTVLSDYPAHYVWEAVQQWSEAGNEFAPGLSQVKAYCKLKYDQGERQREIYLGYRYEDGTRKPDHVVDEMVEDYYLAEMEAGREVPDVMRRELGR